MRIAINLALFEHLSADEGAPKTKDQLASKAGADSNLIGRILKHLASTRVIEEVAADKYRATPISAALTVPKYRDAIVFWYVLISCVDFLADKSPAPKRADPSFRNCQPSSERPSTKSL